MLQAFRRGGVCLPAHRPAAACAYVRSCSSVTGRRGHRNIAERNGSSESSFRLLNRSGQWTVERDRSVAEEQQQSALRDTLRQHLQRVFLPAGYPNTVSPDYWPFQKWLNLQWICGSAAYVLSTHALLTSVGIASQESLALSASINWVLKDGLSCLGVMFFASRVGAKFDLHLKRSKFLSDLVHNLGVVMEMMTPMLPGPIGFIVLASLGTLAKSVAGLANGAVKANVYRHFSSCSEGRGMNLGDITAKGHSQSVFCYLAGMMLGIGCSVLGDASGMLSTWGIFGGLVVGHVYSGYRSLTALTLHGLDSQRAAIVSRSVVQQFDPTRCSAWTIAPGSVPTPQEVSKMEKFVLPHSPPFDSQMRYRSGSSVSLLASLGPSAPVWAHLPDGTLRPLFQIDAEEGMEDPVALYYIDLPNNVFHTILSEKADERVQLHSHLLYSLLATRLGQWNTPSDGLPQAVQECHREVHHVFDLYIERLQEAGWKIEHTLLAPSSAPRFRFTDKESSK